MILAFAMMEPWFAVAGLAAISLPLWMHLYQRVARRRVAISSLRLVPEAPRVARSRRRIRHWPLFLLRALGVLLLGLAFARPGLPASDQSPAGGREAVVFVLDRTGSMVMRSSEGSSAWEETLERVNDRLSGLHPQSRVRLFCFPPVDGDGDWLNPTALRKILADLTPSLAESEPVEALRAAAEALARFESDMPEALEIIGDLQRGGWQNIETLTLPEELRVRVSQTGDPAASNRGLSLQVRGVDQLRRAMVALSGGATPLVVRDQVGEDGDVMEKEIPLPGEVIELPYRVASNGWVRRELAFRQATDGMPDDDRLFDAFFVAPEIPVYLLEPHPERAAFLQTTFFLHQALRPTAGNAAADSRFFPQVVPVKDAVEVLRGLDGRESVLVVPALAAWPPELPAAVEAFVEQGGGVVFFAGQDLQPQAYATGWQKLLPALPGEILSVDLSLALPPIRETHSIWGGLSEDLRRALRKVPLKKRFALELAGGSDVTARYADDVPLVATRSAGAGRSVFVNTSPDRTWGDWPTNGVLFVPTMHMLMSAAVTSTAQDLRNSPGAGIVDIPFDVRVDPVWAGAELRMGERTLQSDEAGWVRGLLSDRPGMFEIRSEDGRFVRPVAVNFPPAESKREFFSPAILQRQFEARRRVSGLEGDAPRISLASESEGWRWILGALAIVWLAEPWLAFRGARNTDLKGITSL
jgi:hypothetical protein